MTSTFSSPSATLRAWATWPTMRAEWRASWLSVLFICLSGALAATRVLIAIPATLGLLLIPVFGIGFFLLAPTIMLANLLAIAERSRISALLGVDIAPPQPVQGSLLRRMLGNQVYWKNLIHVFSSALWGGLLALGFSYLVDQVAYVVTTGIRHFGQTADSAGAVHWPTALADVGILLAAIGIIGIVLPVLCRGFAWTEMWLARFLLAGDQDKQISDLSARVDSLKSSRMDVLDSVNLERSRIERDLHDGPQQRLTAVAMDIGIALRKLDQDPEKTREILQRAHTSAKDAVTELRQVIRGIDPPILTERGLPAALPALSARCPLPTSVDVALTERPHPTIESIVHFCVSEALTNVTKHAQATEVAVTVRREAGHLVTTVTDDGQGGVDQSRGTGLLGLQQRLSAVDGHLDVHSPAGGPTILTFYIPWPDPTEGAPV